MGKDRVYSEEVKNSYKRIVRVFENFDPEGITILTGNNGSGKSLFRKQLPFAFQQYYGLSDVKETKGMIRSTSMDARTSSNPEWGALSGIMNDTSWIATSQNTFSSIKNLFESLEKSETKYLVIDEYEIGCSEETIVAIARFINENLKRFILEKKIIGAMIITHSRMGLKEIEYDHFVNIEGLSADQWVNREIIPTDLNKLDENELFFYIRDLKNN